jgi:hypothetical protein
MPRTPQPAQRNVLHLRLDETLRQQLQREADKRRFTLTNEVRVRLLDSLDDGDRRGFEDIRRDMEICWARFSARFLRMELADQLADAVMSGAPPDKIQNLARLIIEHRATEQRATDEQRAASRPPRRTRWTTTTWRPGDPS